jgi:hypothetical protein
VLPGNGEEALQAPESSTLPWGRTYSSGSESVTRRRIVWPSGANDCYFSPAALQVWSRFSNPSDHDGDNRVDGRVFKMARQLYDDVGDRLREVFDRAGYADFCLKISSYEDPDG